MNYPTMEQAQKADKLMLGNWSRHLSSPGMRFVGKPEFEAKMEEEAAIMNYILRAFNSLGGWTPELSKQIGWDRP